MRILFWQRLYGAQHIGGVEILSAAWLEELHRRGHALHVVAVQAEADPDGKQTEGGIPVTRLPFHRALLERNLSSILALKKQVSSVAETFRPDVVQVNATDPGVFFLVNCRALENVPLVVTLHDELTEERLRTQTVLASLLQRCDRIVAISRFVARRVTEAFPEMEAKTRVILNGYPDPGPARPSGAEDPAEILFVGRLAREKGADVAIEAFDRLAGRFPDAKLAIAGDGPARAELERQVGALASHGRIRFEGWIRPQDVMARMAGATVVVVPSRWQEPFGLVAVQAGLAGRPAIVSNVGGLPEIVEDGVTGYVVAPEAPVLLEERLERFLTDPEHTRQIGAAARRLAVNRFNLERVVEDYLGLYAECVERSAE